MASGGEGGRDNGRDKGRRNGRVLEAIGALVNVFGPKPIAIIIFVIMLTTTAVMTGYAVYAWSARQSYMDISEINDRQISSLQELLKLNDDLRKQKVELEQTIKRLKDVEDNVLVIRDEQSVELQN